MSKKDCRLAIRVSEETKEQLQILADNDKRKLANFIRYELEAICEQRKEIINKMFDKD